MSHPPFDLVFCRDDPDGEIAFVFTGEILRRVEKLFPAVEWTKHNDWHGWWVAGVYRSHAANMAQVAHDAGLRVATGEFQNEKLVFTPWESMTQH